VKKSEKENRGGIVGTVFGRALLKQVMVAAPFRVRENHVGGTF
jgi:hypothetical protein